MAKKKKQTRARKAAKAQKPSIAWPIMSALTMIVIALFLLLGAFNAGGDLPKALFDAAAWVFGLAAVIVSILFLYFGFVKLLTETHKVPVQKLGLLWAIQISAAALFHVVFFQPALNGLAQESRGGVVGAVVGGSALGLFDKIIATILFMVIIAVLLCFVLGVSPRVLLKPFVALRHIKPQVRGGTEVNDLASLKAHANQKFELKEGVPLMHSATDKDTAIASHASTLKNTAQALTLPESHEALTTRADTDWQFPPVSLLNQKQESADAGNVPATADIIHDTYANFNIDVVMEGATVGPTVTQYMLRPPSNVKLTKITALENNLALNLAAQSLRIEAPIPGKSAVGIEVPNKIPAIVRLSSVLNSKNWNTNRRPLAFTVGKDISGDAVIADLADMPHVLIAGQTKSGKSVMINSLITSLLYHNTPSDLKLIMVDPKIVELGPYNDIPHLLTPVINDPEKCISALKWAVAEMERRYKELEKAKVRNIEEYNSTGGGEKMPFIVIIIDELADLMMMAARDVEALIVRIAQKARAVGLHLVLATQRPSVDVITGLIKANVPARIAFAVNSQVDSRTIIDQIGAEKLLGKGDMLFATTEWPKPIRVQGAYISTEETQRFVKFLRDQRLPQYDDEVISQPVQIGGRGSVVAPISGGDSEDDLIRDAIRVVIESRRASTSLLQRKLRIGYGKAARVMEAMEEQGVIGPPDGSRSRNVLVNSLDEVYGIGIDDGVQPSQSPTSDQSDTPRERFLVQ